MVDINAVVAVAGWGERTVELAGVRAPGTASHIFAADIDQDAVIAVAAEGVRLAGFQVDQAGGLRACTARHICSR